MDEKPQVKDIISFTLKRLCNKMESLRLQCDVLPKTYSFCFSFLPKFSTSTLFDQQHSPLIVRGMSLDVQLQVSHPHSPSQTLIHLLYYIMVGGERKTNVARVMG